MKNEIKKLTKLFKFIACASLLSASFSSFASDAKVEVDVNEKNTSLNDNRVPTQYLPIIKDNVGDSTSFAFIDKTSVKQHPYNPKIRTYTHIVNYGPALLQDVDGVDKLYRSMVIQQYVNCDKKEFAKGMIKTYENYFGEGALQSTNDTPKRWESTAAESKERQSLIVVCGLPLN